MTIGELLILAAIIAFFIGTNVRLDSIEEEIKKKKL
jgi:hypothetical protein